VQQVGDGDSTPPRIVSLSASPTSIDTASGDARIDVAVTAEDDMSGVDWVYVTIGQQYSGSGSFTSPRTASLTLDSGDHGSGVWKGAITIPAGSPKGAYTITVSTRDAIWNPSSLTLPAGGTDYLNDLGNVIGPSQITNG